MHDFQHLKRPMANQAVTDELVQLFTDIAAVIQQARQQVQQAVNSAMVQCYWQISHLIPAEAELKHELELERIKVQAQLMNKTDEDGND
jgi:hypothetical protein